MSPIGRFVAWHWIKTFLRFLISQSNPFLTKLCQVCNLALWSCVNRANTVSILQVQVHIRKSLPNGILERPYRWVPYWCDHENSLKLTALSETLSSRVLYFFRTDRLLEVLVFENTTRRFHFLQRGLYTHTKFHSPEYGPDRTLSTAVSRARGSQLVIMSGGRVMASRSRNTA